MAVPEVAVVAAVAIAVLVEERRVVEVGMRRRRQREDPRAGIEAHRAGIEAGRPDIGKDFRPRQHAGGRRPRLARDTRDRHVEDGDVALGRDPGVDDVEGSKRGVAAVGREAPAVVVAAVGQRGKGKGDDQRRGA